MNIHISVSAAERRIANGKFANPMGSPRQGTGLKWGKVAAVRGGPSFRVLNSAHFDPAHAPDGARLVRFADLEAGQCQWGFNHEGKSLFCGCPIDPDSERQFSRYCAHHAVIARNPEAAS